MSENFLRKDSQKVSLEHNETVFHVTSLSNLPHKLGYSKEGYPKFFVVVHDSKQILRNLNAELLSVEYDVVTRIKEENQTSQKQIFTIITLHSDNEPLKKTFVDVFSIMLASLPKQPTKLVLAAKIESLLTIFAKIKRKPIHKIQGLWAELLLIERSSNPELVAKAWHNVPEAKYDFTMGNEKVEVKSTSSENRIHTFSLDQLNPSVNSELLICSVIVRESAPDLEGLSIFDLYDRIGHKISDDDVRLHVYEVMLDTVGSEFYSAQKKFFDYTTGSDSMSFYQSCDIPKISKNNVPEHVTEVKFKADLGHLKDVRDKIVNYSKSSLFSKIF